MVPEALTPVRCPTFSLIILSIYVGIFQLIGQADRVEIDRLRDTNPQAPLEREQSPEP